MARRCTHATALSGAFSSRPRHALTTPITKPSEIIARLGVVQLDDPLLRQRARPFALPEEAEDARRVVAECNQPSNASPTVFNRGVARLTAHEIDHLAGVLYTDRMADNASLIPVEQYRGGGQSWQYA